MEILQCDEKKLVGLKVRTKNENERNASTSKIATLWNKFYDEVYNKVLIGGEVYGVYSGYESDHNGNFDVFAAVESKQDDIVHEGMVTLAIESGKYLVFSTEQSEGNLVLALWQQVWQYFSQEGCPHKRAFTTDYEVFNTNKIIKLHIAIL